VSAEVDRLTRLIGEVTDGMAEQAKATQQIAGAVGDMRKQSGQLAQAVGQQTRATKDMSTAAEHIAKQMAQLTRANREHSVAADSILKSLTDIRAVTDRNARGVEGSRRATDGLRDGTAALAALAARLGRTPPGPRRRK
jgi:methyl-accepting chemotaxis protein